MNNSKIFSEQRLQSLCKNQMLLKSLLKMFLFHKGLSRSLRSEITFGLISGVQLSRASWKQNWIKDIWPVPFCEAFGNRQPCGSDYRALIFRQPWTFAAQCDCWLLWMALELIRAWFNDWQYFTGLAWCMVPWRATIFNWDHI